MWVPQSVAQFHSPDRLRYTGSYGGRPIGNSIAAGLKAFKLHVRAVQTSLVDLFHHHGARQSHDGCIHEEYAQHIASMFDLFVEPLQPIG